MPRGSKTFCYDYPRPAVTVDLALFALDVDDLKVLLIRRKHDPYAGHWAFPGGFIEMEETLEVAIRRELREETGLDYRGPLATLGIYADPDRDPRGRTISVAHAAVLGPPLPAVGGADDAVEAAWLDIAKAKDLAFDHDLILDDARRWLSAAVLDGPAGLVLLPRSFGDEQARALFRAIGAPKKVLGWRNRHLRRGDIVRDARKDGRYRSVMSQRSGGV